MRSGGRLEMYGSVTSAVVGGEFKKGNKEEARRTHLLKIVLPLFLYGMLDLHCCSPEVTIELHEFEFRQ